MHKFYRIYYLYQIEVCGMWIQFFLDLFSANIMEFLSIY